MNALPLHRASATHPQYTVHLAEVDGACHLQQARHVLVVRVRSSVRTTILVLARVAAALTLFPQRSPE